MLWVEASVLRLSRKRRYDESRPKTCFAESKSFLLRRNLRPWKRSSIAHIRKYYCKFAALWVSETILLHLLHNLLLQPQYSLTFLFRIRIVFGETGDTTPKFGHFL